MAGKSNPSIYDDRTTIGSAEELDEYGVWVKSEPQDLSNSIPEIEELPDFDDAMSDNMELPDFDVPLSDNLDQTDDDEPIISTNIEFEEIPENSDLPEGLAPTSLDKDGFSEVSMTDFLDSSSGKKPDKTEISIDFGDLDSTVPEIASVDPSEDVAVYSAKPAGKEPQYSGSPKQAGSSGAGDLSTQLLQRIADELSSIKKEISSLKTELSVVRGEIKSTESTDSSGFFDEEDDEKIALTGDELDNILNTANFTEETGSGEGIESDISFDDSKTGSEEILFEDNISELEGELKEESTDSFGDDFEVTLDLGSESMDDSSELEVLRKEGAVPLTAEPPDTSYLEEETLISIDDIEEIEMVDTDETVSDSIDFSGAVIEEPDLSMEIMENPVSEPAIDNISIDLEMQDVSFDSPSGSDDFIFETEDTMELPLEELPELDDEFPDIESIEEDLIPDTGIDLPKEAPKAAPKETPKEVPVTPDIRADESDGIPNNLKQELKIVLSYMDQLLESLPEEKIEEFAKSEYFDTYKKLFEELGLV